MFSHFCVFPWISRNLLDSNHLYHQKRMPEKSGIKDLDFFLKAKVWGKIERPLPPKHCLWLTEVLYTKKPDGIELPPKLICFLFFKDFPVIFHGVTGMDEREASSPSFFNVAEVEVTMVYVRKLLASQGKKGVAKIAPKDIGIIAPYRKQVRTVSQDNHWWLFVFKEYDF